VMVQAPPPVQVQVAAPPVMTAMAPPPVVTAAPPVMTPPVVATPTLAPSNLPNAPTSPNTATGEPRSAPEKRVVRYVAPRRPPPPPSGGAPRALPNSGSVSASGD